MASQIEDVIKNNLLLESACDIKEERCEDYDFVDDKVHVFQTAVNIDNVDLKNDVWLTNNMRQYEVSTSLDNIKTELLSSDLQCNMNNDNMKLEEEINDDNIKVEFENGLLYCENCHAYYKDYCIKCGMLVHILNNNILCHEDNKARKHLPSDILEIRESFGQLGIFALKIIPEKVIFGPFTGISGLGSLKIKGGKFVVNKDLSKYLNWMQYINYARNVSERNLLVLQCKNIIYYQSTRQILEGDELLIYFGEDYDKSLNGVEMDFIPTTEYIFDDVFACMVCCLGFSSKLYLDRHVTVCRASAVENFSIKELIQCPSCKIHLDRKEYFQHHEACCWERKYIPPTSGIDRTPANGGKPPRRQTYKCEQCTYTTRYKGELNKHANQHNEVKTCKCGICNRRFKTTGSLRLHEENAHVYVGIKEDPERAVSDPQVKAETSRSPVDLKQFKCSLCDFRTKYKLNLKLHIKTKHLKQFDYKCDSCDFRTNQRNRLKRHIKGKHLNEFDHKCVMCVFKTNRKSTLEKHVKVKHLEQYDYKCEICSYKTISKSDLGTHVKTTHLKEFDYKCDVCAYKTNKRTYLESHVKAKHLREFTYKCQSCTYKTNFKSKLKRHVITKHTNELDFKCGSCEFKTNCKSYLEKHWKAKHLKEFDYKCDICNYGTVHKANLESHMKTVHLKQYDYECEMCDYKSNKKSNLDCHVKKVHLKELDFKCQSCTYKTNIKSHLQTHVKTQHRKEFNYKCDLCDYKVDQKSKLERHIKAKHLNEFDYKCDACEYKTDRKTSLNRHMKSVHLKEYDHKCEMCNYKSSNKNHLECHVKTIHLKVFDYKCQSCTFETNYKSKLKSHVRTKH